MMIFGVGCLDHSGAESQTTAQITARPIMAPRKMLGARFTARRLRGTRLRELYDPILGRLGRDKRRDPSCSSKYAWAVRQPWRNLLPKHERKPLSKFRLGSVNS